MKGRLIELKCAPKIEVNAVVATPACMKLVDPEYAMSCLASHMVGEWGLVDDEDKMANDAAIDSGARIMSVWPLPNDPGEFWIITEADRSVTTFLLPSDY